MRNLTQYNRYDKCRLSPDPIEPDVRAFGLFEAGAGKTVALAPESDHTEHGIYLSDNLAEARSADTAVVISCGADCPYSPGETVAFAYGYALRVKNWQQGDVSLDGELRFYGSLGDSMENATNETNFAPRVSPWEEYALMVHREDGWKPLGRNILLELPEAEDKFGIIMIAEIAKKDPVTAIISEVGPKVKNFKKGQEVVYYNPACRRVVYDDKRYLIVDEDHVYSVVR